MTDETIAQLLAAFEGAADEVETSTREVIAREDVASFTPVSAGRAGEAPWTPSEIVGHLGDAARIYGGRMRRVVYEDAPPLEIFDEALEVRNGGFRFKPLAPLVREYLQLNAANVAFLRARQPGDWERTGTHAERGPMTLRALAETEAAHEQGHVRQLVEALQGA